MRWSIKLSGLVLLFCSLYSSAAPLVSKATDDEPALTAMQQLLQNASGYVLQEAALDAARRVLFGDDLAARQRLLEQAKADLREQQRLADQLKQRFDRNEKQLVEQEDALRLRVGNLGEMFGVVRQVASDLQTTLSDSLTKVEWPDRRADLQALSESRQLPDLTELEALWHTLQQEMTLNGQVTTFDAPVIDQQGRLVEKSVTRIGVFNAMTPQGYLAFDTDLGLLRELGRQPASVSMVPRYLQGQGEIRPVAIDPSRGALLNLTLETPDWRERVQQGGSVGYIIIGLGVIGLLIAAWRLITLLSIQHNVNRQQAQPDQPNADNPLGRVLLSYRALPANVASDVIEAKMDEAVLRELPGLERGQSIIKLFAGIAPLLGLLGTVTGMIATFQAITNFGTGDPKLMAAGISQALITTVLGLVAAIPLLLAYTWVASHSKRLIQLLDEQSAGILASSMERAAQPDVTERSGV